MNLFDLIVIGGGSGGIAAARQAASHGAKVLLIEGQRLGGTCVNVGCVPKKVMWNASEIARALATARDYGFDLPSWRFDWSKLKSRRDAYIERLNEIYQRNLDRSGVEVVRGQGRLLDRHRVQIGDKEYQGQNLLIAVGGQPVTPKIPGASYGLTSDGFFGMQRCPQRVMVVGGGYIGAEIAGVLAGLGSKVTLVSHGDCLLRFFEQPLVATLLSQMTQSGIQIRLEDQVTRINKIASDQLQVQLDCSQELQVNELIWAIGRRPRLTGLGAEELGIQFTPTGHIAVSDDDQTSVPGIYAIGDVTGKKDLTPVAIATGRHLANRLFGGSDTKMDFDLVASVVFSHPPLATVGMTTAEAITEFGRDHINVYESKFTNMFYAVATDKPQTHIRLITKSADHRILGVHILGMAAEEMIQGFAVAIKMGATKADFDRTIAVHPVAAEELVTLKPVDLILP